MMGKVEIIVNGKHYPCGATMGAMLRFKQQTGHELNKMTPGSLSEMCTYLWCCVKSSCVREGIDFDMDLLTFADNITPEDMMQWHSAISEGQGGEDDGEKKTL